MNESKNNYIDNAAFYAALIKYKAECDASPDNIPQVSNYIGNCIIKIAEGMARRPNFNGYSWRNDMIGDGIETCIRYVKSFDPEKSKNPFGYFSQIVWYAFISRIQAEKKQSKIKREILRFADADIMTLQEHDKDGEFTANINEFLSSIGDEETIMHKEPKTIAPGKLEQFMEKRTT